MNLGVIGLLARRRALAFGAPALGLALIAVELLRPRPEPPVAVATAASSRALPRLRPEHTAGERFPPELRFGRVLWQKESPFGRVTVGEGAHTIEGNRALFINYRDMCHSRMAGSELLLADIAVRQLSPKARVLNVGLGCGFVAGRIASSDRVTSLDIAEINPIVVEATRRFFGNDNHKVLELDKTRVLVRDGAELLRQSTDTYDAIVIDIEEPTIQYSSPLYTRDYFEIMKTRLTPDGMVALWCIGSDPTYAKILYNSLRAVFPHVRLRIETFHLLLFASMRTLDVPEPEADERARVDVVLNVDTNEVNTVENRALERHFDIRRAFVLPREYDEKYFTDHGARPADAGDGAAPRRGDLDGESPAPGG